MTCPSLVTALKNSYSTPSDLFVNGTVLKSEEGVTQGDPLAMAMYGLAILPMIRKVTVTGAIQKWYADDGNATGQLQQLRTIFDTLEQEGPKYGYLINGPKCQIITRERQMEEAKSVFHNTGVQIGVSARVLGSVIGEEAAVENYCKDKIEISQKMTRKLTEYARSNPHPVYSCLTKGFQNKLSFLTRTTPFFNEKLSSVEDIISDELIPNMTGRGAPSAAVRDLLSLPVKMGGLNIQTPSDYSEHYKWSKMTTEPLYHSPPLVAENIQNRILNDIKSAKDKILKSKVCKVN